MTIVNQVTSQLYFFYLTACSTYEEEMGGDFIDQGQKGPKKMDFKIVIDTSYSSQLYTPPHTDPAESGDLTLSFASLSCF